MKEFDNYIGVFDSGVGGISVLKELVQAMPNEHFLFYGDSAHAPYGDKDPQTIARLSGDIATRMIDSGCKAIVIACNTATSAAAEQLRTTWPNTPIIGIEPALKPAARAFVHGRILVMATAATLKLEKFHELAVHWGSNSEIHTLPCPGLVDLIETGDLDSRAMRTYLEEKLGPYRGKVDAIVLGCTHYPFIKRQIAYVMGEIAFFDGGEGTARHTKRKLQEHGIEAPADQKGRVVFRSSIEGEGQRELYERLYHLPLY
ncbi:glutamate racemase [Denitrobacterium detoxificans]|uniref:Glutamate racemase n=1 Tax=Denitrobacterium detoxificans TaxID=79604 RepID=A0A172RXT8_9ACTN|nr:glutamate racemase [Denitrobacterium detoxificans]ANE22547.1 glutamate racemase [Denitrobacterium detoxificans]SEP00239.1 glutamate racemase [Denitrobacterium detoxificans]